MSFSDTLAALNDNIGSLTPRDRSFALSLLDQWNRVGSLSQKQSFWIDELARRATEHSASTRATQSAAAPAAPASREFLQILALFASAGSRAAIVFHTASGKEFRLSVAGERAQQPGSINVTDAGTSFENRVWYGRITTKGVWQPSRKVAASEQGAVEAALAQFNADPAAAAASYGHAVGACCFCRRELTDARSVSVGYGPICADRFGLPWGETAAPKADKLTCEVPF